MADKAYLVCPHCEAVNRLDSARLNDAIKCGECKQPLFDNPVLNLSEANFRRHLTRNSIPLLVDFWAPWCGPCRIMAPAYEQAARELQPQIRFAKLNTEQAPNISSRFAIRSIPTLILFKNGEQMARQSGAMSHSDLIRWLRSQL